MAKDDAAKHSVAPSSAVASTEGLATATLRDLADQAEMAAKRRSFLLAGKISEVLQELSPDTSHWIEIKASIARLQGFETEARRVLNNCLEAYPLASKALQQLMQMANSNGKWEETVQLAASPALDLTCADEVVRACDTLAGQGIRESALAGLSRLIDVGTEDVDVYIRASRICVSLADAEKNNAVLGALKGLRPHNVYGHLAPYHAAVMQTDRDGAKKALLDLNKSFPNNSVVLNLLCDEAIDDRNAEEANEWLNGLRGKISGERIRKLELQIAAVRHDWPQVVDLMKGFREANDNRFQVLNIYAMLNQERFADARQLIAAALDNKKLKSAQRRWFQIASQITTFKERTGRFSTDLDYKGGFGPGLADMHVPEVIRTLWVGGKLSPFEVLSLKSFVQNGFEVELYSYDEVTGVPDGVTHRDASEIMPKSAVFAHSEKSGRSKGSYAGFADIFRWHLLNQKGGFWSDCDVICLRPFELPKNLAISSELARTGYADHMAVTNCFFGGPAHHSFFETACEHARNYDPDSLEWGELGTFLIGQLVEKFDLEASVLPHTAFNSIPPYDVFNVLLSQDHVRFAELTANSWGVHLYNEVWRSAAKSKVGPFPRDSVLHKLFAKYDVVVNIEPAMPELILQDS